MDTRYNISELFNAAFGIKTPIYTIEPNNQSNNQNLDYSGITYLPDYYKTEGNSWLNTPIIGLLKFKAGSYPVYTPNGEIGFISFDDYIFPPTTLFSFRRAKNITKTNLLGASGTVKEIFGFDDWVIDVKGLCLDDVTAGGFSAREKIRQIEEWEEIAGAINISSKLFTSKKIAAVVIENYNQEAVQASPGVIPFSMTLCSDDAIELILPAI
jgi:hypothetical protein